MLSNRLYASSINNIPPIASSTALFTFGAVCPTYSAIKPDLSTVTTCPFGNTPIAARISPNNFATVVFPVPGLPVKTICILIEVSFESPLLILSCSIFV